MHNNKTFRMQSHRHVRFLHLLQSTTDVQRKTVRLGNADVTSTESHRFRRSTLGKASDVKPRNVPRAVELRKRKSVTRSASKQPVKITNVPEYALVTVRSYTVRLCTVSINLYSCPCVCRQKSRQALERGRDANEDHDSDAMKSSGSLVVQ